MLGSRYGELFQDPLPRVKSGTTIDITSSSIGSLACIGKAVAVNPNCGVSNYCSYHVDQNDKPTIVAGFIKRVAVDTKAADKVLRREFYDFVRDWVCANLSPLRSGVNFDIDHWLDNTNYSESRKQQLRDVEARFDIPTHNTRTRCKSFIKDEFYEDVKYARTINARADWFKVYSGPLFKAIEHEVFKMPCFVKYIPVSQRPSYVAELMQGSGFVSTSDFKAFEGSFSPKTVRNVEGYMYKYMLSNNPVQLAMMHQIVNVLCGRNNLYFKNVKGSVKGVRMSGEMCTSLGNGFTNLMLVKFYCYKTGNTCLSVIEGDDGLHLSKDPFINPSEFFMRLGFQLDFKRFDSVNDASFCGVSFDANNNAQVDCRKPLLNTTWLKQDYVQANDKKLMSLLRARGLSLLHRLPGCPVVTQYALMILRWTLGVKPLLGVSNNYEKNQFLSLMKAVPVLVEPDCDARMQYERNYKVNVEDQIALEEYFKKLSSPCFLSHPVLDIIFKPKNALLWNHYVTDSGLVVRFNNDKNEKAKIKSTTAEKNGKLRVSGAEAHYYTRICAEGEISQE
jgi:hypothetical protein